MKLLNEQIQNVRPTQTSMIGKEITIYQTLLGTMINQKARLALTEIECS